MIAGRDWSTSEVGVMVSPVVTLAAAIMAAIMLTTAWSISMLPRARDVAVTVQTAKVMPLPFR
jgi:hypothetical protein